MASEKNLSAKKVKVEELTELLKGSISGVLVDYRGITVEEDTKLRKELREAGVKYFVEKNSILDFAFKNVGLDGITSVLSGTTALAVSAADQTAPARILGGFAEKAKDKFNLKASFIEGVVYDEAQTVAISKIPSKDALLSQLVGSLQGPIQKLAATLLALSEKDVPSEEAAA